jgi:hypothetical protein
MSGTDGEGFCGVREEQYIVARCILPLQGKWYDARARNKRGMPVEEE